jgi:hypothetical protein
VTFISSDTAPGRSARRGADKRGRYFHGPIRLVVWNDTASGLGDLLQARKAVRRVHLLPEEGVQSGGGVSEAGLALQ